MFLHNTLFKSSVIIIQSTDCKRHKSFTCYPFTISISTKNFIIRFLLFNSLNKTSFLLSSISLLLFVMYIFVIVLGIQTVGRKTSFCSIKPKDTMLCIIIGIIGVHVINLFLTVVPELWLRR